MWEPVDPLSLSLSPLNTNNNSVSVYTQTCIKLSKSSDLRTHYLPEGQADAEVFVKRNIDISSKFEAILYLFQFQNKNGRFPVCLIVTAHAWDH